MSLATVPQEAFRSEFAFWLRIMKEHALFLENGFSFYQVPLIREAACFFQAYGQLESDLAAGEPLPALVTAAAALTKEFLDFKLRVLARALECSLGGSGANLPLLVDHIAREAEAFLRFLGASATWPGTTQALQFTARIAFWLKIMVDHLRFIYHLLDPSQVVLLDQAAALIARADMLLMQTQDYRSMLRATPEGFAALMRSIDNVTELTRDIRDFKAAGTALLQHCRALAIVPALLLDHTRREAEFFLAILAAARKDLEPLLDVTPQSLDAEEIHNKIWAAAGCPPPAC